MTTTTTHPLPAHAVITLLLPTPTSPIAYLFHLAWWNQPDNVCFLYCIPLNVHSPGTDRGGAFIKPGEGSRIAVGAVGKQDVIVWKTPRKSGRDADCRKGI
jgi:hypothetical protein